MSCELNLTYRNLTLGLNRFETTSSSFRGQKANWILGIPRKGPENRAESILLQNDGKDQEPLLYTEYTVVFFSPSSLVHRKAARVFRVLEGSVQERLRFFSLKERNVKGDIKDIDKDVKGAKKATQGQADIAWFEKDSRQAQRVC